TESGKRRWPEPIKLEVHGARAEKDWLRPAALSRLRIQAVEKTAIVAPNEHQNPCAGRQHFRRLARKTDRWLNRDIPEFLTRHNVQRPYDGVLLHDEDPRFIQCQASRFGNLA